MARPKAFDTDEALQQAVEAFWSQGYEATSVQDLLNAMGINRGSLYTTYGDKQRLFQAAMARYRREVVAPRLADLEDDGSGLAEIEGFFAGLVARARDGAGRKGCLMTNTCVELAPHDSTAAAAVRANLARIEAAFAAALEHARQRGELATGADTAALARFLVTLLQGLQVMSKAGLPAKHLEDAARTALAALR